MVVFPELYKSAGALVHQDAQIFVKGKINTRDDIPKIIAEEIVPIEEVQARFTRSICIDLNTAGLDMGLLTDIKGVLAKHRGATPVFMTFRDPAGKAAMISAGENLRVKTSDDLLSTLERLAGENCVKIK